MPIVPSGAACAPIGLYPLGSTLVFGAPVEPTGIVVVGLVVTPGVLVGTVVVVVVDFNASLKISSQSSLGLGVVGLPFLGAFGICGTLKFANLSKFLGAIFNLFL